MKKVISKAMIILSTILFFLSICAITSMECLKGRLPIQESIIDSEDVIHGLNYADISKLPHEQIFLFYIGLVLLVLSSIVYFTKSNKLKGFINIVLSFITITFVLITHNYIWFLILLNMYLFMYLISELSLKDKMSIIAIVVAIVIGILNVVQLMKHIKLEFDLFDISGFEAKLVELSDTTIKLFVLWIIPYTVLFIKDIFGIKKQSYKTGQ